MNDTSSQTGRERAAIVIAGRDGREILGRELSARYGADYQIVVCDKPGSLPIVTATAASWFARGGMSSGRPQPDSIQKRAPTPLERLYRYA